MTGTGQQAEDRGDRYLVVGAGSSGLTAAKNLRERGLAVDVVERNDEVGGNWYFGAPTSRVYRSTHMISSKPFTQYPDFPMPDDAPDYLHHSQVHDYLRAYTDHFGLHELIEFDTSVEDVAPVAGSSVATTPDAPRWEARLRRRGDVSGGDEEVVVRHYAGVVIANGHNWYPKLPSYPGQDRFDGDIIHSADYRDAGVLRGRRVLVVGAGNTGCDIAVEAAQEADATFHSTRRGYWYAQKYTLGKPTDQFSDMFFGLGLPHRLIQTVFEASIRMTIGDFERHGLKAPDHRILETHPIVNESLIHHVGHGDITPVDDVERFERDRVVFTDGRSAEVDLVVFATGYLIRFPFLDHSLLNWRAGRPLLFRNVFSPDHPNLAVIGLIQPDSGQFNLVHWQSVALARYLLAQRARPEVARRFSQRIRDHLDEQSSGGVTFVDSTRHYVEVEHLDYVRDLATDINHHLDVQRPEPVLQRLEWAFPAAPVKREILRVEPEDGTDEDRPPLLFVHGAGHGARCWEERWMPAAAAAGWTSYAVSLRGDGDSEGGDRLGRTLLRHYVHDVLQAIATLPSPPVVVGHSIGALVVQAVLERYPARAGVLVAPVGLRHGLRLLTALARFDDRLRPRSPLVLAQAVLPRRARGAKAPVLVLGGGDDPFAPPIETVRTARHYRTRARLFRGMRHDLMLDPGWEAPLQVMLRWLEGAVDGDGPVGGAPAPS